MTGTEPMVSLIVPVKNGGRTIGPLLESVKQIDYPKDKLEVIIVDGHSTDATREIVRTHGYETIFEESKGANGARNTGMRHSRGEIIAFTDSDCVVPRDWVKKTVKHFSEPSIGCVGGNTVSALNEGMYALYADNSVIRVYPFSRQRVVLDKLRPFLFPPGCNMAFRREALEKIGLFNTQVIGGYEETELYERLFQAGDKIAFDPDITIRHHHRATLRALLKQAFQYGKGAASVVMITHKSKLASWLRSTITTFLLYIAALVATTAILFTFNTWLPFLAVISLLLVPLPILALYYARTRKTLTLRAILLFPFIDMTRFLTYGVGEVVGLMTWKRSQAASGITATHSK